MEKEQVTRHLRNFLSSYTLHESSQLLNQVSDHVTEGIHYVALDKSHKEELLDFLEGLEELLPAVYELHEKRSKPESEER